MHAVLVTSALVFLALAVGASRLASEELDRRPPIDRELHEKIQLATFALG